MAISFIIFQHIREKEFKVELLKDKLKDYNTSLNDNIIATGDSTFSHIEDYIHRHALANLRVTIISKTGDVIYDNLYKDYKSMSNHLLRDEIIDALKKGEGSDMGISMWPITFQSKDISSARPCHTTRLSSRR